MSQALGFKNEEDRLCPAPAVKDPEGLESVW